MHSSFVFLWCLLALSLISNILPYLTIPTLFLRGRHPHWHSVVLRGLRGGAPRFQRFRAHRVLLLRPQEDPQVHLHFSASATGGCLHEQHLLLVDFHGPHLLSGATPDLCAGNLFTFLGLHEENLPPVSFWTYISQSLRFSVSIVGSLYSSFPNAPFFVLLLVLVYNSSTGPGVGVFRRNHRHCPVPGWGGDCVHVREPNPFFRLPGLHAVPLLPCARGYPRSRWL